MYGQWWSKTRTQRLHVRQCFDRTGLTVRQVWQSLLRGLAPCCHVSQLAIYDNVMVKAMSKFTYSPSIIGNYDTAVTTAISKSTDFPSIIDKLQQENAHGKVKIAWQSFNVAKFLLTLSEVQNCEPTSFCFEQISDAIYTLSLNTSNQKWIESVIVKKVYLFMFIKWIRTALCETMCATKTDNLSHQ